MSSDDLIQDDPFDWIDEMAAEGRAAEAREADGGNVTRLPAGVAVEPTAMEYDWEPAPAVDTAQAAEPEPAVAASAQAPAAEEGKAPIYASEPVRLPPELTLETLPELKQRLVAMLGQEEIILVEGDAVEVTDTAALQLLASFFRSADQRDVFAGWNGASATLRGDAATLGMTGVLGLADA